MNRLLLLAVVLFPVLLSSCSLTGLFNKRARTRMTDTAIAANVSGRYCIFPQPDTFALQPDTAGTAALLCTQLTKLLSNGLDYNTLVAKCKVHYEAPENQNDFTANIRVKRDSAIWIDISALGGIVHAARVLITPDSLWMISYLQREVTKLGAQQIATLLPTNIDFASLQNIITGEHLRQGTVTSVTEMPNRWLVKMHDSSFQQRVVLNRNDTSMMENFLTTIAPNGPEASIFTEAYVPVNSQKFSSFRKISVKANSQQYYIELDMQNINLNSALEFPFNIPKNYKVK